MIHQPLGILGLPSYALLNLRLFLLAPQCCILMNAPVNSAESTLTAHSAVFGFVAACWFFRCTNCGNNCKPLRFLPSS
nr:uncharacterized protein CTRU02_11040 [Colletotrichum truncatum]KAF6786542.1 hypothetical protein CTRU02_11040 [Colletotrichum truncatum]